MTAGRSILMLAVAALVVSAASLYWYVDPWEMGVAAAATHPGASGPIPVMVSNITAGDLAGVRGLDAFAAGAGLYVVAAASDGGAILVINVTDPYGPRVVSSVINDGATALGGASAVDITRIGSGIYAVVASASDDGLQVLNLTDPTNPVPVASLTDDGTVALAGAYDVDTFAAGSGTYAVVASASDDGLQVLNLTDPADPIPVASLTDDQTTALDGAVAVETIQIGSGIYAVSVSPNDDGLQILNLTDPADPIPVASLTDDASVHLGGARGVDTLDLSSGTYAVAVSSQDDGLQVVEITDPADPVPVARVPDDGGVHAALRDASAVDTFMMNGNTYAVVAAADGIAVVEITDPAGPMLVEAAQNNPALYGASAIKAFHTAGHVYAAVAIPDGGGAIRIVSLGEMDSVPPNISSATWAPADRTIALVFSEPLDHTATDYPGITILGESANLTLADIASMTTAGRSIDATLGPAQEAALGIPRMVHLLEGAVRDMSANPIPQTSLEVTMADLVPPTVSSATYDPGTGLLAITFSEPLNHTATIHPDIAVAGPIQGDALRISALLAFIYPDMVAAGPVHLYPLDKMSIVAASNMTIEATLDATQIEAVGLAPMLYMMEGAVRDTSGNPIGAVRGLDVTVLTADAPDAIPPVLASSYYNTGTGILNVTFSEPLNGTTLHYDRLHIRDIGRSTGGLTLDDIASRTLDANSTMITLTPSDDQRQMINTMNQPELDIGAGAVTDIAGNMISAAPDQPITMIDGIPPTVVSAAYNTGTGILNITFSEPLGPAIDYSGIKLAGENGNVTLDDVSTKSHLDETIASTLNTAQRSTVGDTMTLSVSEGAVADPSDNGIAQTTTSVDVADGIPPVLLSSSYNTGTGILSMTFSEPLDPAIHYDRLHIRDIGRSTGGLTLDDIASRTLDANSTTITLTPSDDQRQMINTMNQPELDIGAGAVTNIAGNMISAAPDQLITVIDGIPPTVVSVDYTTGTGILVITFSEPLGNVDYSGVSVIGTGGSVALDDTASSYSGDTITAVLDTAQRITAGDSPTLSVSGGAVSDISGNPISPASNIQITVEVTPVLIIPDDPPRDTTPPRLLSSYYTTGTGALNMTFSEPLRSQINYTGIILVGPSQNLTLDTVTARNHTIRVINATLDGPQRAIVGERPGLSVEAGAVSDRSGNRIPYTDGILLVIDGMPPEFVSSYYNTGTGVLNVTFNEPLERAGIRYDLMHVRDAGQAAGGLSLGDVTDRIADSLSTTMTVTLSDDQRRMVNAMNQPELDIGADAVSDIGQNQIPATPNQPITVIDGIPPTVTSVAYNTGTGILVIIFSEPLNGTAVDYSGVSVVGPTDSVALDEVAAKEASGERITATLDAAQRSTAGDAPGLSVSAGAVSDVAGNPILSAAPEVTTTDGIPPTVSSSSYNTGTGLLSITFSEPLSTTINYAGFTLTGHSDSVALDDVSTKSHSGDTITATLDAAQRITAGNSPTLSVSGGAVADLHDNLILSATPDLTVIDGIPPTLASSYYNTGTGILNMTFSEPLEPTTINYGSIAVRETGDSSGGISLGDVTARAVDPSNKTLTLTLSNTQRQTVNDMASPELDITADAVADPSNNGISAASDQDINIIDGIPPTVTSVAYTTGSGILNITFSEPLGPAVTYSGIELAGENGNVALDDISTKSHSGGIITATLNAAQQTTVGDTMTLSVSEGAVADPSDNDIAQTTIPVDVTDGIPPTLLSSSYNVDTGVLNMTFSEPLDHTATDYTKLTITGQNGNVTLDQVAIKTLATSTIWATLNAAQMETVGTAPTLIIDEGAVSDIAGNGIVQTTETIKVTMLGLPIVEIRPVAAIADGANTMLDGAFDLDLFEIGGRTYAAVTAYTDDGVQIINLTNPASPSPIARLTDTSSTVLNGPIGVDTFTIAGRTYAAVATGYAENGVQIINLTNPASPSPVTSITDGTDYPVLRGAWGVDTFTIAGRTYAAVVANADDGVQIIELTDPASLTAVSSVTDGVGGFDELDGPRDVDTFTIAGRTYAAVTANADNGVQIIELTDPASPTAVSSVTDGVGGFDELDGPYGGVDTFTIAGRTYAAVTAAADDGVQIIELTDPASPTAVSSAADGVGGFDELDGPRGVDTFVIAGRTYAMVVACVDDGVQIIELTDPASPSPIASLTDTSSTVLDCPQSAVTFTIGNRIYAAVATGFVDNGIQILQLLTKADLPPEFHSATYHSIDKDLAMTFDREMNGTATDLSLLGIRGADGNLVSLANSAAAASGRTVTVTLDEPAAASVSEMAEPTLVMGEGAVTGIYGNLIAAGNHTITVLDVSPPTISSASYYNGTGLLSIEFSEPLNHAATDYTGLTIVGQRGNVTLDHVAGKTAAGSTISATLNATQMETAGAAATLAVSEGAVYDPAGNGIVQTTETIEVTMLGPRIVEIRPVAAIADGANTMLDGAFDLDLFEIGGRTYAAVAAHADDGVQIIELTNPASPTAVSSVTDGVGGFDELDGPRGVDTFTIAGRTYAAVTASADDGVQIIELTNPASPTAVSSVTDGVGGFDVLDGVQFVDTFTIAGRTYAAVTAYTDDGVQIINLTNPASPSPIARLTDTSSTVLNGPRGVDTFTIAGRTYAAVTAAADDGVQIIELTNPASPTAVSSVTDGVGGFDELDGPRGVDTFTIAGRTYAAVTASADDGVQIIELTNPASPTAVSSVTDGVGGFDELDGVQFVDTFTIAGRTYAAVAAAADDGVQIIELTDPASPTAVSSAADGMGDFDELDGAQFVDTFTIAGRTYVAVTAEADDGVQILQLLTEADIPVNLVAATYHTLDRDLAMTFDREMNGTATDLSLLGIRGADGNLVSLANSAAAASGRTVTVTLDEPAAASVSEMAEPVLVMGEGAVTGIYGNLIAAGNHTITVLDVSPPTISSASYYNGTGLLSIEFSEPLNHAATDYTGLTIVGQRGNVTLDHVAGKTAAGSTISATLNATQMETAGAAATLAIGEGAVYDPAGNGIVQTTETIKVTMLGLPIVEIRPVAAIADGANTMLYGAFDLDLFEIGGRTYAAVTAYTDGSIQIIELTDPASPSPIARLTDTSSTVLNGPIGVDTFTIAGRTYAAVATAYAENGVQIINLTNPASPSPVTSITDGTDYPVLRGAWGVDTFTIAGRTYAAVAANADDGVQIIELTDPASPTAVSSVTDGVGGFDELDGPRGVDTFTIAGRTYAAVAANADDGVQIIELTDPASPTAVSSAADGMGGFDVLDGAQFVDTFTIAGRTYVAVTAYTDDGVQIIEITDPASPTAVSSAADGVGGFDELDGPRGVDTFTIAGRTYAMVVACVDDGVQIIELTDPASPSPIASLTDTLSTVLDCPSNVDTFPIAGRTYAAVTSYGEHGIQILQLLTEADIPVNLVAATYHTLDRDLAMTFDKEINGTATDLSLLGIRGADGNPVSLANSAAAASGRTVTVTLDEPAAASVSEMAEPVLVMGEGAVTGIYGNLIAAGNHTITILDISPPLVASSSYNIDTGILNITFNEPLNHTATDYSGLIISGQQGNVTLDQVATKTTDVSTIWATLNATQMETAGAAATLAIGEGAVYDPAGNGIVQTTETIEVTMLGPPIVEIKPVGRLVDTGTTVLGGTADPGVFTAGSHIYAAVAAFDDNALQVVNITDPDDPRPLGHLSDTGSTALNQAWAVAPFESGGRTYAVVTSYGEHGIQVVDLTNPASPTAAGRLTDTTGTALNEAQGAETFESGGRTYAVVTSFADNGIQVVNLTNPASPTAAGRLTDTSSRTLGGAYSVAVFESGGRTYAVVASFADNGIQVVDLTDPASPTAAGSLTGTLYRNAYAVDTIKIGGFIYGVVGTDSDIVALVDLTDPDNPRPTGSVGVSSSAFSLTAFESGGYHYALVGPGYGHTNLDLVDVSDPANPVLLDTLNDGPATALAAAGKSAFFSAGGLLHAIVGSYQSNGIQIVRLYTEQDLPPVPESAKYGVFNRTLSVQFNKDLDSGQTNYTKLHIRNIGEDTGGISLDAAVSKKTVGSRVIATFDGAAAGTILAMTNSTLDIEAGAVTDTHGLRIDVVTDQTVERIFTKEVLPPEIVSAGYGMVNDTLRITFNEDLNHTATDYSGMRIRDIVGDGGGIGLSEAFSVDATGNTITAVFGDSHGGTIGGVMAEPYLMVDAGAVTDTYGNSIEGATLHIVVDRPFTISYVAHLDPNLSLRSDEVGGISTWTDNGRVYALALISLGEAILNVTDPYNPVILYKHLLIGGDHIRTNNMQMVEVDGRAHAWVFGRVSNSGDQNQYHLFDLGDPAAPSYVRSIADDPTRHYTHGEDAYQVSSDTSRISHRQYNATFHITNVTDPAAPVAVGSLGQIYSSDSGSLAWDMVDFGANGQKYILLASKSFDTAFAVNVTDPYNPVILSSTPLRGGVNPVVYEFDGGTYAAILGSAASSGGMSVLNLTNPANLTLAGSASTPAASDIDLFESGGRTYALLGVAYEYTSSGAAVVDVTNPANLILAALSGEPYLSRPMPHISHFEVGGQDYAVGATTIEFRSGTHFAHVPVMRLGSGADDVPPALVSASYRYDGLLYMTFTEELGGSISLNLTRIRDAGGPAGPSLQGAVRTAVSGNSATVWLSPAQMAAVEALARPVLDIETGAVSDVSGNPAPQTFGHPLDMVSHTLTRVGDLPGNARTAYFYESGGHRYAAITSYGSGSPDVVSIYNASDPLRPRLVGAAYNDTGSSFFETTDHFEHDGRTYLVIVNESGHPALSVVDVTDPRQAETVSQLDAGVAYARDAATAKIFWRDDIPYMSALFEKDGRIFNMSDPASPAEVSAYPVTYIFDLFQRGLDHFESGGSTYAIRTSSLGLSVFDVSYPARPTELYTSRVSIGLITTFGHDDGSYALIDQYTYDVTDPRDIAYLGSAGVLPEGPAGIGVKYTVPSIFVVGERLYAATGIAHLSVLDVSDPFEPRRVAASSENILRDDNQVGVLQADDKTYVYATGGIHLFEEYLPTVPVPPTLELALYNPGNRFVQLNFGEPVRRDAGDIHIRPAGNNTGGVALAGDPVTKSYTMTFKLTAGQADTIDAMGAAIKVDMERGAVRDLDSTLSEQSYENPVTIQDPTPPRPASAVFDMDGHILAVTFDEPLNGTVSPDGIVLGYPRDLSLAGASPEVSDSTVSYTLDRDAADRLAVVVRPTLSVTGAAVFDVVGNPAPALLHVPITVRDDTPPGVSAASFNGQSLRVVFTETMARSSSPVVSVRDAGGANVTSLSSVWNSRDTISVSLTTAQANTIASMARPLLNVEAGTAADLFGNPNGAVSQPVRVMPFSFSALTFHGLGGSANYTDMDHFSVGGRDYLAGVNNIGVFTVNVTDPAAPAQVASLRDGSTTLLDGTGSIASFVSDGRPYAVVSSNSDNGIQVVNMTDPANPVAAGQLSDIPDYMRLQGANRLDIWAAGNNTYAAVVSYADQGVQLVNLTEPEFPRPTAQLVDAALDTGGNRTTRVANLGLDGQVDIDGALLPGRPFSVAAWTADDGAYLAVLTTNNVTVVDVSDPEQPVRVSTIGVDNAFRVDTWASQEGVHALVTSTRSMAHILNLTDPADPALVAAGPAFLYALPAVSDVGNRTYALLFSSSGYRQGIDLTDPADPLFWAPYRSYVLTRIGYPAVFEAASGAHLAVTMNEDLAIMYLGPSGSVSAQEDALVPRSASYQPGVQSDQKSDIKPRQSLGAVSGQSGDQLKSRSVPGWDGNSLPKKDGPVEQAGSQGGQVVIAFSGPINGTVLPERLHIRNASFLEPTFALSGQPEITNGNTTTFTLDPDQDAILRNMTSPLLDIEEGAVYDTDGNPIPTIIGHPIDIPDTIPPTLDSAAYLDGTLELAFSEPLNGTTILPERMRVLDEDSGQPGIHLSGIPFGALAAIPAEVQPGDAPAGEPAGTTLTFWMNSTIQNAIGNMTAPVVSIAEAAVYDTAGNHIEPATVPVDLPDKTPPEMDSAAYHTATNQLAITFSEPLNHTATDYALLSLVGPLANVTLAQVGGPTSSVNATIAASLNATHIETLGGIPSAIAAKLAAVYDTAGNPIAHTTIPITTPDTTPPQVESASYDTDSGLLAIIFTETINHTATDYTGISIRGSLANLTLSDVEGRLSLNATLSAPLNQTHLDTLGTPAHLDVAAAAVSDMAGNPIAHTTIPITTPDTTPPQVESASYDTDSGLLAIIFTETINHTATDYTGISIRGSLANLTVSTVGEWLPFEDTLSVPLNQTYQDMMGMPVTLIIEGGAASDLAGNPIQPATIPVDLHDTAPPEMDSATYHTGTSQLAITFSEPLNHTHTDYALLVLLGPSTNVTLAQMGGPAAAVNGTIAATLNATHIETLGGIPSAVAVKLAAVHDMAGNPIQPATVPVGLPDTTPPTMDSATYHSQTGQLNVTFSEPLNHTHTDYTLLSLVGPSANVTLAHINERTSADLTIGVHLNATHIETLGGIPSAVAAKLAAVHDTAGNPIQPATIPIDVSNATNHPPVVDAGADRTALEGSTVYLNGTASDQDGDPLTYLWSHDRPALNITLAGAATLSPSFTAPQVGSDTTITLTLTVADPHNATASDSLNVTIRDAPVATSDFVTTWRTTQPNEPVTIPTGGAGAYTVDWGDGTTSANVTGSQTHQYASPGDHTIRISGDFSRIHLGGDPDNAAKLVSIDQWGDIRWTTMREAFAWTYNMVYRAADAPDLSSVADMGLMFAVAYQFNGDISSWDVSNVTNMEFLFYDAFSFNGDISSWSVSNVTNTAWMFAGAFSFNQNISSWDVSSATNMTDMLSGALSFQQNLGGWYVTPNSTSIDAADAPGMVGTISSQNAYLDGQNPAYTIGTGGDSASFNITGTNLVLDAVPDKPAYTVNVTSTGGFGTGNHRVLEISVTGLANRPPIVDAGPDLTIPEGGHLTLNGTASDDDEDTLTYLWSHDRPALNITLAGATTLSPSFTAPQIDSNATIIFTLTATDIHNATSSDQATITITDIPANRPPIVDAGPDLTIPEGGHLTLNGTASDDDEDTLTYLWSHDRPALNITLAGATTLSPSFTAPQIDSNATIIFTLTATDIHNATSSDQATITITDIPANRPPIVDAGPDLTIPEGGHLTLNGTASDDDEDTLTYLWSHDRPALNITLAGATTLSPSFTAPQIDSNATIIFTLTATDIHNATSSDQATITITDIPANRPPIVDAGPDLTIPEGGHLTLNGTASDDDEDTLTYLWSHDRPALNITLAGATTLSPSFTAPQVDSDTTVTLTLTVSDGTANTTDSVRVTITDGPPSPPTNLRVTSTVSSVTLTWDDPGDDTITGYKILSRIPATQPDLRTLINDTGTSATTYTIPNLEPDTTYIFRITALSDYGESKFSDSVNASTLPDRPPAITLVGQANMTISVGSTYTEPGYTAADDVDGDITANVTVSGTVDVNTTGTYAIQYDVADSSGNAAETRIRTVTVEPVPISNPLPPSNSTSPITNSTSPITNSTTSIPPVPPSNSTVPIPPSNSTVPISNSTVPIPPSNSTVPISNSTVPIPPSNSTVPISNSTVPISNSTVPIPPSNSTVPISNSTVPLTNSTMPVTNSTMPVTNSTMPVTNSTMPVTNSTMPVTNSTMPVTNSTMPVTNSTMPVTNSTMPVTNSTMPVTNSTMPVTNSTMPVTNSTMPVTNSTMPVTNSTMPVTNSTMPVTNSTMPVTNSTMPVTNSTMPVTNSTAVNGPPMTPSETRGIRGLAPDAIQSGAIRISWETPDEAPRDYRVSWAKTAEPFLA